jgi:hypothetical protein
LKSAVFFFVATTVASLAPSFALSPRQKGEDQRGVADDITVEKA